MSENGRSVPITSMLIRPAPAIFLSSPVKSGKRISERERDTQTQRVNSEIIEGIALTKEG